ncbi:MAG: zeta toxin family protein [Bacteroidales bacterium]|nr:zeta toxin family protein [Bacteroidales bacterium]
MVTTINEYDKEHIRNVDKYARIIDRLYEQAIKEATALGLSVALTDDDILSLSSLPQTANKINNLQKKIAREINVSITNGIEAEWALADKKNDDLVRSILGSNIDRLTTEQIRQYFTNNDDALRAFTARRIGGLDLSQRIWQYVQPLKSELELALDTAIRDGTPAAATASTVKKYLQQPDNLFRRVRDRHGNLQLSRRAKAYHPGQGVYRSSYKNAMRLTRTETNMAYHAADSERWGQLDFIVGQEIRLSNNHTLNGKPFTDICDELQGRYPKTFKFAGWHPQCRCISISVLKTQEEISEDTKRMLRGEKPLPPESSKNYIKDLPDNFREWLDKNAERIARATDRGALPYFLRDNKKFWSKKSSYAPPISKPTTAKEFKGAIKSGATTQSLYSRNDIYAKERKILHEKIISDYLNKYDANQKGGDTVYMLGGAPANGKSTLVNSGFLPHPKKSLIIDTDKIRLLIPEYGLLQNTKDKYLIVKSSNFVHNEASYIAKQIRNEALKRGYNVVLDGVNNNGYNSVKKSVDTIRSITDKKIRIDYTTLDTKLSLNLAKIRGDKTGRYVEKDYIIKMNEGISAQAKEIMRKGLFDEFNLWDTNINGKPILIARAINGKIEILDDNLWERFLRKGI